MCGCGGGGSGAWMSTSSSASSGSWSGSGAAQSDGPWVVKLPVYETVDGKRTVTGFETVEVGTYIEADSLVRQRDPATGEIRGGGISRKRLAA